MASTDRRTLLGLLAAGGWVGAGQAQAFDASAYIGVWSGTLMGRLRLRLTIKSDTSASLVSIDQGGSEFAATAMTLTSAGLHMDFAGVKGRYDGKLDGDTIKGTWTQGQAMPLDFARGDAFKAAAPVKVEALVPGDLEKAHAEQGLPGVGASFAKGGGAATIPGCRPALGPGDDAGHRRRPMASRIRQHQIDDRDPGGAGWSRRARSPGRIPRSARFWRSQGAGGHEPELSPRDLPPPCAATMPACSPIST